MTSSETDRSAGDGRDRDFLATTLEAAADGLVAVDQDGAVRYHNRRFVDLLDLPDGALDGADRSDLLRTVSERIQDPAALRRAVEQAELYPDEEGSSLLRLEDGRVVRAQIRAREEDGDVAGWVLSVSDVTVSEKLEAELERLAYRDPLTGLANARLLSVEGERALALADRHGHRAGFISMDLVHFKRINDTLGHERGDEVLGQVASRLRSRVRAADAVARIGGDEFGLLLTEVGSMEGVQEAADRLAECFDAPIEVGGESVELDVKMGVALYPDHASNFQELLASADDAVERAAERYGEGSGLEQPAPEVPEAGDLAREEDLRRALDQESLKVHYQAIRTGPGEAAVGMEALVRWPHPVRGTIGASETVPLAERIGVVRELDYLVLRKALTRMAEWERRHPEIHWVSVNLSAATLHADDLSRHVESQLESTGLDGRKLVVEVAERVAMRDPEAVSRTLASLRDLGVRVAIDDFGTGRAVLGYLKQFDASLLKLDMPFIHRLGVDPRDERLFGGMVAFAHELEMSVVAEGVETEDQYERVRAGGCDLVQGYYTGRPAPASVLFHQEG